MQAYKRQLDESAVLKALLKRRWCRLETQSAMWVMKATWEPHFHEY